jgi:large subunit ribosomal protein L4
LVVVEDIKLAEPKTKVLNEKLTACGLNNSLFIDGKEVDMNFALASRNLVGVDVLPTAGANVYDILRKEKLVLTKDAVVCLGERLK